MPYKNYYLDDTTLIVHGNFFGVSTGLLGGWKSVKSAFNHTVSDEFYKMDPVDYLKLVAKKYGLKSYFGLLTAVSMKNLSIKSHDSVTAFVTAGVDNPNDMTINIILVLEAKVSKAGLLNAIITATEAKSKALFELGYKFTGTTTDAVVVLSTMNGKYERFTGPATFLGKAIWKCVSHAVKESLEKG
ncbi:MAG: adenosylcobinamide amidohydrolase [Archaeoglobaceae archaeon]